VTNFASPYAGALMAIPFEASTGNIWVTDHQNDRISEFDPSTSTWVHTEVVPSAGSWVVAACEDPATGAIYFTQFSGNSLLVKTSGTPATEVSVSNGGPAFCEHSGGKIYYSQWNNNRLGAYDIATGNVVQYTFPIAGEFGGPTGVMPNGDVVVGGRNIGYVFIFHPGSQTFDTYQVPTFNPGLKDGLHVDRNGDIWVTETQVGNKIARLAFQP